MKVSIHASIVLFSTKKRVLPWAPLLSIPLAGKQVQCTSSSLSQLQPEQTTGGICSTEHINSAFFFLQAFCLSHSVTLFANNVYDTYIQILYYAN